jgi:hypothetical protein
MASGLQCPGCGHVHPSGLPEIARGDATFRCYGCYRTLSIPEGWTGRATPRPSTAPVPTVDAAPPGAGTRDARTARLAGRRGVRTGVDGSGEPTQMVPMADGAVDAGVSPAPNWPAAGAAGGWAVAAGTASGTAVGTAAPGAPPPLGWVSPRRSGRPVPQAIRALVWAAAFGAGLFISAFLLKKSGLIDVNTAIDLFAGSGPRRFGFLVVMLPLWALLSATIAHLSLEALARRRRPRPTPRLRSETPTPG